MTTEHRNSYRCPIIDETPKGVIRVGRREVIVALTNQSAGGFSVTAQGNLRVREGQMLAMRTSAGWIEARVIHRRRSGGQTTIGMLRLSDLPDPRDAQLVKPGGCKFERVGGGSTASGNLLLVAIVAGVAFWGFLVNFAWFRGPDVAGKPVDLGAYVSRMLETVTSFPKQKHSSADTDVITSNPADK